MINFSTIGRAMTHNKPLVALEVAAVGLGAVALLSGCAPERTNSQAYAETYSGIRDATHGDLSSQDMAKVAGKIASSYSVAGQTYEVGTKAGRMYEIYLATTHDESAALNQTISMIGRYSPSSWK